MLDVNSVKCEYQTCYIVASMKPIHKSVNERTICKRNQWSMPKCYNFANFKQKIIAHWAMGIEYEAIHNTYRLLLLQFWKLPFVHAPMLNCLLQSLDICQTMIKIVNRKLSLNWINIRTYVLFCCRTAVTVLCMQNSHFRF